MGMPRMGCCDVGGACHGSQDCSSDRREVFGADDEVTASILESSPTGEAAAMADCLEVQAMTRWTGG